MGGGGSNRGLWLGEINRTQLNKVFSNEHVLEINKLDSLRRNLGGLKFDNLVVPTLHYGLNSTNGGIAGAANIYAYTADNADVTDNTYSNAYIRTVHEWARQCLDNVSGTASNYSSFKVGMIFRLDLYGPYSAGSSPSGLDTPNAGTSAYDHLRSLKQFAKGDFAISDRNSDSTTEGGDGEELHSGDLFQIVYVPDDASIDNTALETGTGMIRFAYVGVLTGNYVDDDGTTNITANNHDSKTAYMGLPAYTFAHSNDDPNLFRIRTTSKNQTQLNDSTTIGTYQSSGSALSFDKLSVDSIDLGVELGIPDFEISTISECKSCDADGKFGGDTTNKNYHMGYGKLWVARKGDYDKLYLVDVTNWDRIDATRARLSATIVNLDFSRIHTNLLNLDDSEYGTGLVRLWYGDYGEDDKANLIGDYTWNPIPEGQYISSICETYSHKPHLGDGALDGANNGDGKWRVWVSYSKTNNEPHTRWDLFLFNFRPQTWGQAGANDTQASISSTNSTVYMFDKTPPYQECVWLEAAEQHGDNDSRYKIYYPYDKFGFSKDEVASNRGYNIISGAEGGYSEGNKGHDYLCKLPGGYRRNYWTDHGKYLNNINFRNPSGEWHSWHHIHASKFEDFDDDGSGTRSPMYFFNMGGNLGWNIQNDGHREWQNFRHCLKPHFKKWYYTGNGTDAADIEQTELGASVAHIVNFFGRLKGDFVQNGGTLRCAVTSAGNSSDDGAWYGWESGETKQYDNDITMFTMHDSPVAFSTLSGSANEETAAFSSGEAQGAPSDSTTIETNYTDLQGNTSQRAFPGTEAGFRVDKSVPATQGYSRYNQYRFHHDNNGTHEINKDTGHDNESVNRPGYGKGTSSSNTTGGAYYGQDGFGHYNMITTTWACNQDIMMNNDTRQYNSGESRGRWRVFGNHGLEQHFKPKRTGATTIGHSSDKHLGIETHAINNIKVGTGYCTYGWPGPNDSNDIDFDGGFYSATLHSDIDGSGSKTGEQDAIAGGTDTNKGYGSHYDNRKTVHCWSTTALTDSLLYNTTYNALGDDDDWKIYKSPRCSFRKLELPSGWEFEDITNVDMISWQKPTTTANGEINTGYLLQGPLSESPYSSLDDTMTGMVVVNPKVKDYERRMNYPFANFRYRQTKHASSNLHPLLKQGKIDDFDHIFGSVLPVTKKWFPAIAAYKNNSILTKNLVPGLADKGTCDNATNTDYKRKWYHKSDSDDDLEFGRFNDVYSPIVLGNIGNNEKEVISIWVRPQFKPNEVDDSVNDYYNNVFPYYVCDKLFNFWASDVRAGDVEEDGDYNSYNQKDIFGFDRCIIKSTDSKDDGTDSNLQITEGFGSSAGSSKRASRRDGYYPTGYSNINTSNTDEYLEGGSITTGSHIKIIQGTLLEKVSQEPVENDADGDPLTGTGEFEAGKTVWYKLSYLYDGFQESPLSDFTLKAKAENDEEEDEEAKFFTMKLTLPFVAELGINSRVTHVNIYRKNNVNELYRQVKSISLDLQKDKFELVGDTQYEHTFNDDARTATYEAINGIPESLKYLTPNYKLSCQLNDFLFVSGIGHPKINQEGEHMIFRSKQGKFSVFNWSTDFMDLPTKPIALVAFAGRIWAFDENNVYKINPEGLYIEDAAEGIGLLNSESVVTTDIGMFFCDRNNIYIHNGREASPIGGPILYSQSKPEWQVGYLDAINRAETLGYTPKLAYDPSKQSIYVVLQGYNESFSSYQRHKSRLYSFNIEQKRWDYYECPNVTSLTTSNKGNVIMGDGYQVYNYSVDKRNRLPFKWESIPFNMGSTNYDKGFKSLKISGEVCFQKFNNKEYERQWASSTDDEEEIQDDMGGGIVDEEQIEWEVGDNTHILDVSPADEQDDVKVYVDNVLQTMRIQNRKPNIGHYIGNDPTGSIYKVQSHLPAFETSGNFLKNYNGEYIKDSFSIDVSTMPEFLTWPVGQFKETTKQGSVNELIHLHKGMYLSFYAKHKDTGEIKEEIVKVRDILFFWNQSTDGTNEIDKGSCTLSEYQTYDDCIAAGGIWTHGNIDAVTVRVWRGQLGTKAIDWYLYTSDFYYPDRNKIKVVTPKLKYPKGVKGRDTKVVFQNQKSVIDSFAITYRPKKFK